MKSAALTIAFLPLVSFIIAGFIEISSTETAARKTRNVIPILGGLLAFIFSLDPLGFSHLGPDWSLSISRIMTIISAVIACSGTFLTYSRRMTAVAVAAGGLIMMVAWMFNFVVV